MFSVASIGLLISICIGLVTIGNKIFDIGKKIATFELMSVTLAEIKQGLCGLEDNVASLEAKINTLDAAQKQQAVEISHLKEHIKELKQKG